MPLIIGNSATGNPVAAVKKLKKNKKGQVVGSTWGDPYQYAGQSNVALSEGKMPGMPSNQEEAALRALSAGYNQIFHHPPDPDTADQLLRSSVGDELQTDSHGWAQLFQGNQAQRFEESQMSPQDWIDSLANTLSWEANPDVHGDHAGFMTAAQPTTVAEPVTPAQHQQAALAAGGRAPGARLVTEYHAPEFGAPGAETAQDLPFSYSVVQQSGQGTYPHLAPKVKDFISLVNLGRPVKIYGKPATSWYSPGDLVTNDKGVVVPRAGAKPVGYVRSSSSCRHGFADQHPPLPQGRGHERPLHCSREAGADQAAFRRSRGDRPQQQSEREVAEYHVTVPHSE